MLHCRFREDPIMLLEVCVDSVESAIAAQAGGADRLELCANLIIGGTTPTLALYQEIKKIVTIPIHILIRPRFGDFLYSNYEYSIMCQEVAAFKKAGAQGVVIGMLNQDGTLDKERMKGLVREAADMSVVLHRAFDMSCNLQETMREAIQLGVRTILTSGGEETASQGLEMLRELIVAANGEIEIMAGAGINSERITKLYKLAGVRTFHMSGKNVLESDMVFRNERINMGIQGISEYTLWQTCEEDVRRAKEIMNQLRVI